MLGFEIRDVITHIFGKGFPKSHDVSKAIDKMQGREREVVGVSANDRPNSQVKGGKAFDRALDEGQKHESLLVTKAASPEAKQWSGWGTALKPAYETWICVQKPKLALDYLKEMSQYLLNLEGELCERNSVSIMEIGRAEDSSEKTDTLPLISAAINISLSIVLSWKNTLDVSLIAMSTSTIETKIKQIIDLKTLSCYLSKITADSITTAVLNQDGQDLTVQVVAKNFLALKLLLSETPMLSAQDNVTEKAVFKGILANELLPVDLVLAMAPSCEHWILCRKPLGEKTIAENVLKHGTGGINVDASRVGTEQVQTHFYKGQDALGAMKDNPVIRNTEYAAPKTGRFPANLVLSHSPECEDSCGEDCAVRELDEQSIAGGMHGAGCSRIEGENYNRENSSIYGIGHSPRIGDTGGASRFFYCAKASKSDRGQDNNHPTVKSTKLMAYLIRLITPPQGIVLDPFAGSGSTGVAALREGFQFLGIEMDSEYVKIAEMRIENSIVQ